MKSLSKELLGLAGEYVVASELCVRGMYAQLTLGHHKSTDILVETECTMLRIQVKAKRGREWPAISGLYRNDDFLVFVDFQKKEVGQRPDFYILDKDDWLELVQAEKRRVPDATVDERNRVTGPDGWRGLNIRPSSIEHCRDSWEKITDQIQ